MVVTMSIISILFIGMSWAITKLIKDNTKTKAFIQLQQESHSNIIVLKNLLQNAQNVFKIPYLETKKYLYDILIVKNKTFSKAPFTLIKPFKKTLDGKLWSNLKLNEEYADTKLIDEEYYLWLSEIYIWSDVVSYWQYVIYTDPFNQKIKIMDTSIKKLDLVPYS